MKYTIQPKYRGLVFWAHIFVDPFFAMLLIGMLGHNLDIPYLFKFGYENVLIINLILQFLWPLASPTVFEAKEEEE